MDKLLPIQFFEKRKVDEQLTEAGGGGDEPKWVLQDDALEERAEHLQGSMSIVTSAFESWKSEEHELPMIIATTIVDEAIAKTHRGDIVNMLNSDKQENVIGIDSFIPDDLAQTASTPDTGKDNAEPKETRRILSIVTSDELLLNIQQALNDTQGSKKLISSIADISAFEVRSGQYNPQNTAYRIVLIDYADSHRNQLAQQLFENKCAQNGITVKRKTRYTPDMYMYRVAVDSVEELQLIQSFEGVFSIEETRPIRINTDSLEDTSLPAVKEPEDGIQYPTIGVLDSGIAKSAHLAPWILDGSEEYYEAILQDKSHGTQVASVLEYSDELNGTNYASTPGIMMLEAVIIPDADKEQIYPEDLIENVRDAIQRHPEIKVWTMSAGTAEESALDSFSQLGIALDNIADENGVLIIKSVGNSKAVLQRRPWERIAKMADSVRAIVVGSIAGEKGKFDIAEVEGPSPFTRCGPGPQYIIKPDLVAYGGNAGIHPITGTLITNGVRVIDQNDQLARSAGTSFSTPWVARIAAELAFHLDGDFDPLLIKALLIHNSRYPIGNSMSMDDKKRFMGFGMPYGTRDILYNTEHEITLVLRDYLERGSYISVLDFPFSSSLVGDDGLFHGEITVTMVSAPLLKGSEGPEYCQSDIQVSFGTMNGVQKRDTSKPTIRNPYGPKENKNILTDSLYREDVFDVLQPSLLTDEVFARERTLLRHGQKFLPIKKYCINLDEMKEANRKHYLGGQRQWYLKVVPLFRNAAEREAKLTGEVLRQEFCILITIRDLGEKAPVYDEVMHQLRQKNFVYGNVRLRNEIQEHVQIKEGNQG